MAKDEMLVEVKKLISIGKEKGFITYDELNSSLPAELVSSERMSHLMTIFGEMDIEIVDAPDGEAGRGKKASARKASADDDPDDKEEKEESEDNGRRIDLTPGVLSRTDDPVRLYLKEMGSVALLSREGEIEIAKRIEEGKKDMSMAVFGLPMTMEYVLSIADQIKKEKISVREVAQTPYDDPLSAPIYRVACADTRWIPSRSRFLFPVLAMSKVFRGKLLEGLSELYRAKRLDLDGPCAPLADATAFDKLKHDLYGQDWVVYAKRPFAGPETVLTYLSRYTHRVAISNRRLVAFDERGVTFRYKDYRDGKTLWKSMTLAPAEFIRRFLQHVLPKGFHRIRHYGLLATGARAESIETARNLLGVTSTVELADAPKGDAGADDLPPCPCCGSRLRIIETFERGETPRHRPSPPAIRIDTS